MVNLDIAPGTTVVLTQRVWHGMYHEVGTEALFLSTTETPLTGSKQALDLMTLTGYRITVWPHEVALAA